MKLRDCGISVGAAVVLLSLVAPAPAASAPQGEPSTAGAAGVRNGGDEDQAGRALPPARKRPVTPAGGPAPQSNARAREVTCGQVISQNTVLRNDVGPCPGDGIVIGADNIFLNLNGHRVVGNNDQGASGEFAGIRLPERTGVRVIGHPGGQRSGQMGTVSGFEAGVVVDGGSQNNIGNLVVEDNVGPQNVFEAELGDGIVVFDSPSNHVINNVLRRNGIFDGIGVLGEASDNNIIRGNTVDDTLGPSDGGPAGQGIIVNGSGGFDEGVITGTTTEGNIVRGSGSAGLANINNTNARVVGNTVLNNGFTNREGNGIGVRVGFGLLEEGYATRVLVQDNEVHGNAQDGIQVLIGAFENRIVNNDAGDNAQQPFRGLGGPRPAFDLHDFNPGCDSNLWFGNTWGSGLYSPVCVTAGGSGPPAPTGPETFGEPSCSDGFDNDEDGLADSQDPDCDPPLIEGPEGNPSCSDDLDNDGDRLIDGEDPDCQSDAAPVPEGPPDDPTCSDSIDNDRDGFIDTADEDCFEEFVFP